ncbi:MAG: CapA family protein [Alphaproteobacteria bacterium]|nr:CapA family protein [Alphaproteobacteria bacterium]
MSTDSHRQSIGLLGDCMISRPLSVFKEERYLKVRDILKAADTVFANFESNVHPYLDDPFAQRDGGGSYITTEPALLEGLKWFGVEMVASGSSHADDYGPKGILDTCRYLDEWGIVHAGSGRNLAEARAPAYLETPNGRIGLVAATAQFRPGNRAGDQRYDTLGHPGVNGIRHKHIHQVDRETLDELRRIGKKIGWEAQTTRRRNQGDPAHSGEEDGKTYNFLGKTFELADDFGIRSVANKNDVEENLRQVRTARYFSDRVIVSLHCHDQGGPTYMTAERRTEVDDMADFALDFARRCVDDGADIVVMHGPQVPMAVQIYKGKPIFHGIGAFVFQIETMRFIPAEAYERYDLDPRATPADFIEARYAGDTRGHTANPLQWEQVFAVCDFAGDDLDEVRIYPTDLGHQGPRTRRGRPMLADEVMGTRIINRVKRLSARYDTEVTLRDGVGVVTAR